MYKYESENNKEEYKNILQSVGAFSYLFSDSNNIYLNYRVHENSYCEAFDAKNLSRSDIAVDATKNNIGIGLKTFLRKKNNTFQKIAEFNRLSYMLEGKDKVEATQLIKEWRNERLQTSINLYSLDNLIYHCIIRDEDGFHVYEEPMNFIEDIKKITSDEKTIKFVSGNEEYSFNKSKSTLSKKFNTVTILDSFEVKPIENPFEILKNFEYNKLNNKESKLEEVLLPLFSLQSGEVHKKSGLNQWNAGGRKRDPDEVYIPIPARIRRENTNFFPAKDINFDLELPNGKKLKAKICQEDGKALMSNPNKDLGKWLLRDILNLEENEILTRDILQKKGFDSVIIRKINETHYKLDVYLK